MTFNNEKQHRLFGGLWSLLLGSRGDSRTAQLLGLHRKTVARGRREVAAGPLERQRIRKPGGGRKPLEKNAALTAQLQDLLAPETAGSPMGGLRWSRRSTRSPASALGEAGLSSSASAEAARLQQLGYSLRVNRKCLSSTHHPQRGTQFRHISRLRQLCAEHGIPIPSIDTKKKEQVGRFHHPGAAWNREAVKVHDHVFPSLAEGTAVPCGVYDLQANWGTVYVGSSADTPAFAVECATAWWRDEGRSRYPEAGELVILAGGGSNGYRPRAWEHNLQHVLCDPYAIGVTVAHYPSGCSKCYAPLAVMRP